MTGKIKFKMGQIEIECEGDESFLKDEFTALLDAVADFHNKTHSSIVAAPELTQEAVVSAQANSVQSGAQIQLSTKSICSKMGAKSGRDVCMASAIKLVVMNGKETFTRPEILTEMKTATGYFKDTHSGNLSQTIDRLIKADEWHETTAGNYALSAKKEEELRQKIA